MKISKKSWHYRFYAWFYTFRDKDIPIPKDGCSYLRMVLLFAPFFTFCITVAITIMTILITVVYAILGIIRFIVGDVPRRGPFKEYKAIFTSVAGNGTDMMWNYRPYTPPKVGRLPLYPWVVILFLGLVYSIFTWSNEIAGAGIAIAGFGMWCWNVLMSHGYILGISLLTALLFWSIYLLTRIKAVRDWLGFAKEYIKAKKKKICPVIELVDD